MSRKAATADEFELIRRYFAPLTQGNPSSLDLADDAAVFTPPPGREIVVTTDTLVQGIHYPEAEAGDMVARKLLRVNLSDLAAMGARPEIYFLNTAWPRGLDESWIARFAEGLARDQQTFGIVLAGGDTVSTPGPATFTLTAIGSASIGGVLQRAGAVAGDDVYVSGTIGDGALGLDVALGKPLPGPSPAQREELLHRFRLPRPRIELGQVLAVSRGNGDAHAAADVSDGLIADLGHICEVSGVGAVLDADSVPLSEAARAAVARRPSLLARLLTGGDDYELVFTAPPSAANAIAAIGARVGLPLTRIGRIEAVAGVIVLDAAGHPLKLATPGFRHR